MSGWFLTIIYNVKISWIHVFQSLTSCANDSTCCVWRNHMWRSKNWTAAYFSNAPGGKTRWLFLQSLLVGSGLQCASGHSDQLVEQGKPTLQPHFWHAALCCMKSPALFTVLLHLMSTQCLVGFERFLWLLQPLASIFVIYLFVNLPHSNRQWFQFCCLWSLFSDGFRKLGTTPLDFILILWSLCCGLQQTSPQRINVFKELSPETWESPLSNWWSAISKSAVFLFACGEKKRARTWRPLCD